MNYKPYADAEYYTNVYKGSEIPTNADINQYLMKASREIDTMTFNRILAVDFDNLTDFQKDIIQKSTCHLADFEYVNKDILSSILSSYAINGVNMTFNTNQTITKKNGVTLPEDLYGLIEQTGLTCLNTRW